MATSKFQPDIPEVVLTKSQYAALPAADKAKDILYNITDDESSENFQPIITASGVLQGNGGGGITAKAVDNTPTAGSSNLVTSGGVKSALPDGITTDIYDTQSAISDANRAAAIEYVFQNYIKTGKRNSYCIRFNGGYYINVLYFGSASSLANVTCIEVFDKWYIWSRTNTSPATWAKLAYLNATVL